MTNEETLSPNEGATVDLAQAIVGNSPARIEVPLKCPYRIEDPIALSADFKVDQELALAIGHSIKSLVFVHDDESLHEVWVTTPDEHGEQNRFRFSHKDPAVIWPIAERFDCFPYKTASGNWTTSLLAPSGATEKGVDSAALAVALTVIQEQGL